jgi:hypothetical protein
MLLILPIAHKYCMESIEAEITHGLNRSSTLREDIHSDARVHVDLMVASRIVGSEARYQQALQRLISSRAELGLDQAKRIGTEATHTILTAALSGSRTELTSVNTTLQSTSTALATSNAALTRSNTALTNSTTALTNSNTALTSSNTALTRSNTVLTNSTTALTNSNTALTNSNVTLTRNNTTLTTTNSTMTATNATLTTANTTADNRRCRHCNYTTSWVCNSCCRSQA